MPRLDKTGPQKQGSRSGRGLGKCNTIIDKPDQPNSLENNTKDSGFGRNQRIRRQRKKVR